MNCGQWEEKVALYAGDDLAPAEAALVEQHVADCAGCQMLLGGLRQILELLREVHAEELDEAHLAAVRRRVMAELESARNPWWRKAWIYGAIAAAVLLLILVRPAPRPAAPKLAVTPALVERAPELPVPAPAPGSAPEAANRKAVATKESACRKPVSEAGNE